ncbi:dihydrofolate reductase [Ulvibacterium marinum]|uniref:dihydrofolate reductase n=1 Tax=Ulvibacterium marinum TaxID=2419782 RepID=UPI002493F07B|nr:dihydrofolate reductase [Ulvibacterium marinum]
MNTIAIIAAMGEDRSLGKDNDLLWHLPDDFKRFKNLTSGHKIIMGRKTFESFPKPLPNRFHIIVTRDKDYKTLHKDCTIAHSMEEAIDLVKEDKLSFIIGGGEIYKQGEEFANKLELTLIHATFPDADTFFPKIDESAWKLTTEEYHPKDAQHKFDFTYLTYVRNQ